MPCTSNLDDVFTFIESRTRDPRDRDDSIIDKGSVAVIDEVASKNDFRRWVYCMWTGSCHDETSQPDGEIASIYVVRQLIVGH